MPIDLNSLTIKKANEHLVKGDFSAVELAEAYLKNIEKKNKELNAYLEVFDDVIEQAKAAQKKIEGKEAEMLTGIPLAVKDNILIKGRRASAASKILEGYVAPYDATAISKLKNTGAVFLGRANMDEFAMGSSTENSASGATKNPHDSSRVPGGSSGGSAAAVAMGGALAALGSDTGGSVRQPASFCGVVGLKPTYGTVSRHGLMAMGSSLDVIGPLAKTVTDAEILFNAIKGRDSLDSTSRVYTALPKKEKLVVGVPRSFLNIGGVDREVLDAFEKSLVILKEKGYEIRDIELPTVKYSLPAYYIIIPAEVSTNLARFDGVKYGIRKGGGNLLEDYNKTRGEGFGREARRRIILGAYVLSSGYYDAYYYRAVKVREIIRGEFAEVFKSGVDIIATPTAPSPAFKIGEKTSDPVKMYLEDIFTVPANIAEIPALSVPMGFAKREEAPSAGSGRVNLPLGLQFMAEWGNEPALFEAGKTFLGEV